MTSQDEPGLDSMFEAALLTLDLPIIIHGPSAILFANEAMSRALRAPHPSALIGTDISFFVHPDGLDAGRQRRGLALEAMHDVPVKLTAHDGTTLYARISAKRIEWAGTAAILIVATFLDGE